MKSILTTLCLLLVMATGAFAQPQFIQNNPNFPNINLSVLASAYIQTRNTVVIGGSFTQVGDSSRLRLAEVNVTTGEVTSLNIPVNGLIRCMTQPVAGDENIIIGGSFTQVGGETHVGLARINLTTGTVDPNFNFNIDSTVFDFQVKSLVAAGVLYIGGQFTTLNGLPRQNLAAINVSANEVFPFWTPSANNMVKAMARDDNNNIYIGGMFTEVNGEPQKGFAALNGVSGALIPNSNVLENSAGNLVMVESIVITPTGPILGGSFETVRDSVRRNLVKLNASDLSVSAWNPGLVGNNPINTFSQRITSMAINNNSFPYFSPALYIAGFFTDVNGITRNGIAEIDLTEGKLTDLNINNLIFTSSKQYVNIINSKLLVDNRLIESINVLEVSGCNEYESPTGSGNIYTQSGTYQENDALRLLIGGQQFLLSVTIDNLSDNGVTQVNNTLVVNEADADLYYWFYDCSFIPTCNPCIEIPHNNNSRGGSPNFIDVFSNNEFMPDSTGEYYVLIQKGACEVFSPCVNFQLCDIDASVSTGADTTLSVVESTTATYRWLNCADDSPVVGADSASFKPTVTGDYKVEITDGPCVAVSACVNVVIEEDITVGIKATNFNQIKVYPNPAQNNLTIENITGATQLSITGVEGKVFIQQNISNTKTVVDITNLASGIYFAELKAKDSLKKVKLVKE